MADELRLVPERCRAVDRLHGQYGAAGRLDHLVGDDGRVAGPGKRERLVEEGRDAAE
jgi:hypothetical protein